MKLKVRHILHFTLNYIQICILNESVFDLVLAGLIQTAGYYRGRWDKGSSNTVNKGGGGLWGFWRSVKVIQQERRTDAALEVEVLCAARTPFLRMITRQTETNEAEGRRQQGETAVRILRDYTGWRRGIKEQEVQWQRRIARPRVEPNSTVRGTCSRLVRLLPPALIKFTTETDCDDAPL